MKPLTPSELNSSIPQKNPFLQNGTRLVGPKPQASQLKLGNTHMASQQGVQTAQSALPSVFIKYPIPDANLWGPDTYLRFVSLDGRVLAYFHDQALGNGEYNIEWFIFQDNVLVSHQIVGWTMNDTYDPAPDLQIRFQFVFTSPRTSIPSVYTQQNLWFRGELGEVQQNGTFLVIG